MPLGCPKVNVPGHLLIQSLQLHALSLSRAPLAFVSRCVTICADVVWSTCLPPANDPASSVRSARTVYILVRSTWETVLCCTAVANTHCCYPRGPRLIEGRTPAFLAHAFQQQSKRPVSEDRQFRSTLLTSTLEHHAASIILPFGRCRYSPSQAHTYVRDTMLFQSAAVALCAASIANAAP